MKASRLIVLFLSFPIVIYGLYILMPANSGQDWGESFRPAALVIFHGGSSYHVPEFYNAPWTLLPLIPLAILPYQWGRIGMFLISLAGFGYLAYKSNAKPLSVALFLTSFPVVACLWGGELDWLPMLGFVTPAPIALILAATKPQIGIGIALYWLVRSWKTGGVKEVRHNFLPVSILLAGSFVLYGFWVGTFNNKWTHPVNVSVFPYLMIIGLYLLFTMQKRAAGGGLLLSPYYTFFSLSALLVAFWECPKGWAKIEK